MASLVGGIVGTIIGGPIGGAIGAGLGSAIDSMIFAPEGQTVEGPRLTDLKAPGMDPGEPIPVAWGTLQVPGQLIFTTDLREVKEKSKAGGKGGGGGGTSIQYTYNVDIAAAFCEGPIYKIKRIWADRKLLYVHEGLKNDKGEIKTHDDGTPVRWKGSRADDIRIYLGTEDQLIDATLEKHLGTYEVGVSTASGGGSYEGHATFSYGLTDADYQAGRGELRLDDTSYDFAAQGYKAGNVVEIRGLNIVRRGDNPPSDYNGNWIIEEAKVGVLIVKLPPLDEWTGPSVPDPGNTSGTITLASDNYLFEGPLTVTLVDVETTDPDLLTPQHALYADITNTTDDWSALAVAVGDQIAVANLTTGEAGVLNRVYVVSEITIDGTTGGTIRCTLPGVEYNATTAPNDATGTYTAGMTASGTDADLLGGTVTESKTLVAGSYTAHRGLAYMVIDRLQLQDFGNRIPTFFAEVQTNAKGDVSIHEIVGDLCERSGLDASEYDLCQSQKRVTGYGVVKKTTARAGITRLMPVYDFVTAEMGYKVVTRDRNRFLDGYVWNDDLAAIPNGDEPAPAREITRQHEYEMPAEFLLKFLNVNRDYDTETVRSRRLVTDSDVVQEIELPLVMTPGEAQAAVNALAERAFIERLSEKWTLPAKYMIYDSGDVVALKTNDGYTTRWRFVDVLLGMNGVIEAEVMPDALYRWARASDVRADDTVDQDYGEAQVDVETLAVLHDLPLLLDPPVLPDSPGLYVSAKVLNNVDPSAWGGSLVFSSNDDVNFAQTLDKALTQEAITGVVPSAMPAGPADYLDRATKVRVILDNKYHALSGVTLDQLLLTRSTNVAVIGQEVVRFQSAVRVNTYTWELSNFLRGRKGTEWAIGGHVANETFRLMDPATYAFMPVANNDIGSAPYVRAVAVNTPLEDAPSAQRRIQGNSLKPWGPAHIAGTRDGSNNLTLTWVRRARYGSSGRNGAPEIDTPISYEVDVLSGSTVLRTLTTTTSSVIYSAADQTSDGLTPGNPVSVRVYQLSPTVGRGFPGNATV